jgi:hypothetical protein
VVWGGGGAALLGGRPTYRRILDRRLRIESELSSSTRDLDLYLEFYLDIARCQKCLAPSTTRMGKANPFCK